MAILQRRQDVRINYRVDGDGETVWLLFNGDSLPLTFWDPLATVLAAEHTVVRFDQRNAGASAAKGEFSLLDTAADAAAVLAALQLTNVIALGHAWGGRVAQVFARDYPHLCRALVVCGTGGQVPATVSASVLQNLRNAAKVGDKTTWAKALEHAFCAAEFSTRQPRAFAALTELMWPPQRSKAWWNPQIAPSASYWGQVEQPTLMIYGRQDQFGTPANADDLERRLGNVQRVDIDNAGHFVIREAVAEVAAALREFVQRIGKNCVS